MDSTTPFHAGEVAIQAQAGEQHLAARNGQLISSQIPAGALKFVDRQAILVATTLDAQLRPWTSLLAGQPGFVRTESPSRLRLDPALLVSAPDDIFWQNLTGHPLTGLLFIELSTRRRLKVNGSLQPDASGWLLTVAECFPLCPRYIQQRHLTVAASPDLAAEPAQTGTALSAELTAWIARADTCFVGSSHDNHHLDTGHRGGKPGFVRVEDERTLLIPDYNGNSMFNTLGNLTLNPHAALLFVDFDGGNTLQLTGTAEVLLQPLAGADDTGGTGRHWRFHLDQWRCQASLRGVAWTFVDYSPFNV